MSEIAIRVENLSKRYRISLKEEINDTFVGAITAAVKNPFAKLKQLQRLSNFSGADRNDQDIIWALNDVSFEVKHGDVLGVIGKNGAGKTTLLKILSKITPPTSGRVELNGRVASLLEVGTGFHPELTGRENIYLNGTILGMSKKEIDRKLEEIIDFSGVEKFIDTPVKRYSSGMRVRLAFSVAAHLEPEILLIDEVLAVGDTAFQKKSVGKIGEVSKEGRTVMFVSHNLATITALCDRGLLLDSGQAIADGTTEKVVSTYLSQIEGNKLVPLHLRKDRMGDGRLRFISASVKNDSGKLVENVSSGQDVSFSFEYTLAEKELNGDINIGIDISGNLGQLMFQCETRLVGKELAYLTKHGTIICEIPNLPLPPGTYNITLWSIFNHELLDSIEHAISFQVHEGDFFNSGKLPYPNFRAVLVPHKWHSLNSKTN